jgi:predicted component of type VI protein secretion system
MSDEGRLFLEACGASGPLQFEWADPTTAEVYSRDVDQAAFVVGRDPAADLVMDDPSLEPYHAFFQVVDGRLFAFDLETNVGVRWGEIPRAAGWVNRGQPLRIGRYTIRLVGGDRDAGKSIVQPAPTTSRYVSRVKLPEVLLEFRVGLAGKESRFQRDVLDRVVVLAGSSEPCKLRVEGRNIPKFICALIRTTEGLWMTNIFPTEGATVNGALCRFARLEDDDVIQLGSSKVRIIYNDNPQTPAVRAPYGHATEGLGPASQPRAIGVMAAPVDESSPEFLLQPLLEQAGSELGLQSSPFGQALVMMVRLLGDVHRDHLTLVRDELAQIRRLSQDMAALRGETRQPAPRQLPLTHADSPNGASHMADFSGELDAGRPNPEAVKEIVSERLEAWERERQNRWRKLLRLLTQS